MSPPKSLKKLRSASIAFLEDGGSLLHGVDGLIRDIQRTLKKLDEREKALNVREAYIAGLENRLLDMMGSTCPVPIAKAPPTEDLKPEVVKTTSSAGSSSASFASTTADVAAASELLQLQQSVAEVVADPGPAPREPADLGRPLPSMLTASSRRRKKRRR